MGLGSTNKGLAESAAETGVEPGKLSVKEWAFDGIIIRDATILSKEPMPVNWEVSFDKVTMLFNLKGPLEIGSKQNRALFVFKHNQHNLFYSSEGSGDVKASELLQKIFMIQITRDAFYSMAANGNDALKRFADNVSKGKTTALADENMSIDLLIQHCINEMQDAERFGTLKKMYLLSKIMELLVLQADACDKALTKKPAFAKTEYDKERIIYAREYMLQHMDMPPSLIELSKIVGMNEYKLKKGFKELFGTTVFGYLAEARLELAKKDLLAKSKSISQIAFDLGYSSVQHFSTAFKKKFGVSPRKGS